MITQDVAESKLIHLTSEKDFKHEKWKGKFATLKLASSTEKGDIGEDFLAAIIKDCGYSSVEVVKGRRGHYDVRVQHSDKELLFEVKVATLDSSGSFQFNGIRYDTHYTHLFCLGVSPATIGFLIIAKEAIGKDPHKMAPMARGSNSTFKLTKREDILLSFDTFANRLERLLR